jgi:hypothetical protein
MDLGARGFHQTVSALHNGMVGRTESVSMPCTSNITPFALPADSEAPTDSSPPFSLT